MKIRIEDNYDDIIAKAQTGLAISKTELSDKSGLSENEIDATLTGLPSKDAITRIADVLNLNGEALYEFAKNGKQPDIKNIEGLAQFNTPCPVPGYEEMTVNAYIVYDPATKAALIFDSGADASPLIEFIQAQSLHVAAIFLTHTHHDHIDDMGNLREAFPDAPIFVSSKEEFQGAQSIDEGFSYTAGNLSLTTYLTNGHSPGGLTYFLMGLDKPVAIVGDSIFAYSMGGAPKAFETALQNNRQKILSLPEETILCPGHGPLTSVAFEKEHNPFFAK